ncbi:Glycosyl Hydrolase Family 88 [Parapedobacter composti]|uniref:Glycosyl Hydrolase Family 88 n=1 Tax=Parapedobacter composti TaxID=623281 RepID=A0A1I1JBM5_9SPHI|nr:glycoside hydrolase family 88 protein [Parapedobacter composti]SFC43998.1 Glycosyl Hydrolase Family 88 [Parapedobacter composti]
MTNLNNYKMFFVIILFLSGCGVGERQETSSEYDFAIRQTRHLLDSLETREPGKLPKSVTPDGELKLTGIYGWTSGFFPGTLWYLYAYSNDPFWKQQAQRFTLLLDPVKDFSGHHDVGFMINSSYGNGYRFTNDSSYAAVIVQAAKSLGRRFNPNVGAIQSWNVDKGWQAQRGWEFPVIIDNMMNLELLFNATALSGDSSFYRMAVSHADVTLENQFRPDNSCYHVVDYNSIDGSVRAKQTAQGYSDHSAWARGQAWALYGFIMCYEKTGLARYLEQAERVADFIIDHPRLPADKIPYWDFDSPDIPETYRDVSSAAIIASALFKLANRVGESASGRYGDAAMAMLNAMSSANYRAELGTNYGFLLAHSVGSIPHGDEVDAPLVYADYYYLEALLYRDGILK